MSNAEPNKAIRDDLQNEIDPTYMNPYYGRMPSAETIYAIPQQIKNIYDRA
jgi:hypothetical protein